MGGLTSYLLDVSATIKAVIRSYVRRNNIVRAL